jgi:Putative Actinobacterial Holin-X, holin superfamily III
VTAPDDFTAEAGEDRIYRARPEPPFTALINALIDDLSRLVRLEFALFKQEMAGNARRLSAGVAAVAIGAMLAFTAWLAIFSAAIIALAIVWPAWLAALVLGVATLLAGGLILYIGVRRMRVQTLVPQRTVKTLREDGVWIKERVL